MVSLVGIHTLDGNRVAQLGAVESYKRVKAAYPEKVTPFASTISKEANGVTLNMPCAARELGPDIKEELRQTLALA